MEVWSPVLALLVLSILRIVLHNRLVLQHQQVLAAWAELETELGRRLDTSVALARLVRRHEPAAVGILQELDRARSAVSVASGSPAAQAAALPAFEIALGRLVELAGSIPAIRGADLYRRIGQELARTEDRIVGCRAIYNGRVIDLNRRVRRFPSSLVARFAGIGAAESFRVEPVGITRAVVAGRRSSSSSSRRPTGA